jgi:hypothetical protein
MARQAQYWGHFSSIESAVKANASQEKEKWLKAVREGRWAVSHYSTSIILQYREDITEIERYVRQIPDGEFAEFLTAYGAYLKAVILKQNGSDYVRSKQVISYSLKDPKNFFPETYTKQFNEHLKGMAEIFQNAKNCMVI